MMLSKLLNLVVHRSKDKPTILFLQNSCKIYRRQFTKWKKSHSWCSGSLLHRHRQVGIRNISGEIKSPYRHLNIPNITLSELVWEKIDRFPDHTATECGITGRKYSFSQIMKLSQKFGASLLKYRVYPGQTVALVTSNCPEYPIVAFGCLEAGLVVTIINHTYTVDEICHQLKDSEAVCVVTALEQLDTVKAAVTKLKESDKNIKEIRILALDVNQNNANDIPSGVGRFSELISDSVDASDLHKLRNGPVNTANAAVIPYSSGTTGLSKGVQLSHKNLVSNIQQMTEVSSVIETTKNHQDVIPGILPFYHIYGFTAIMTISLYLGSKVVTLPKFEPKNFLDTLKNQKCSILYSVPPLVLFLGSQDVGNEYLQYIRGVICAAAPLGASDLGKFLVKIPKENNVSFRQAYGLTECTTGLTFPPINHLNLDTVGVPLSNTQIKVIDIKNGETLGPNQDGEVCGKGPQVMVGYHNNPKATAATIDPDGWIHTGDIGRYDEHGFLYIVDRIKELIKVKGFQVPPAELEDLLRSVPGVTDAGVTGVPDERCGEVPVAFIVRSSSNPASVTDIKRYISQKAAPYKQISDILFVDSIPKSPSGKILRRVIKETYLNSKLK